MLCFHNFLYLKDQRGEFNYNVLVRILALYSLYQAQRKAFSQNSLLTCSKENKAKFHLRHYMVLSFVKTSFDIPQLCSHPPTAPYDDIINRCPGY